MDEQDVTKKLIEHVDPNRRSFVRRILAGAAFVAPLIATFSIDSLTAGEPDEPENPNSTCTEDEGYVGPNAFQAHIADPTKGTRANGVGTFQITTHPFEPQTVGAAKLRFTLTVTKNTQLSGAFLKLNGKKLIDLPTAGGFVDNVTGRDLCDFDELLQALADGNVLLVVGVEVKQQLFQMKGKVLPASFSQTITLNP
jgi:hypothetical protein